mmetsp:Transcript_49457/g.165128  ORF Transcript_49457/g.165128 Transcript_49457/m.165128 type:complete len:205 (-) Transcript_49457:1251-1865(-)
MPDGDSPASFIVSRSSWTRSSSPAAAAAAIAALNDTTSGTTSPASPSPLPICAKSASARRGAEREQAEIARLRCIVRSGTPLAWAYSTSSSACRHRLRRFSTSSSEVRLCGLRDQPPSASPTHESVACGFSTCSRSAVASMRPCVVLRCAAGADRCALLPPPPPHSELAGERCALLLLLLLLLPPPPPPPPPLPPPATVPAWRM